MGHFASYGAVYDEEFFFLRFDVRLWIVAVGAILHVGIAVTMQLGIFPWAMLALYPAFFHPDELQGLRDAVTARLRR